MVSLSVSFDSLSNVNPETKNLVRLSFQANDIEMLFEKNRPALISKKIQITIKDIQIDSSKTFSKYPLKDGGGQSWDNLPIGEKQHDLAVNHNRIPNSNDLPTPTESEDGITVSDVIMTKCSASAEISGGNATSFNRDLQGVATVVYSRQLNNYDFPNRSSFYQIFEGKLPSRFERAAGNTFSKTDFHKVAYLMMLKDLKSEFKKYIDDYLHLLSKRNFRSYRGQKSNR